MFPLSSETTLEFERTVPEGPTSITRAIRTLTVTPPLSEAMAVLVIARATRRRRPITRINLKRRILHL
jgi:hypothetical protein